MKRKISKEEFDKLDDLRKSLYKLKGDIYELELEDDDHEDTGALKRAKFHEQERRKEAEKLNKEMLAKLEEMEYESTKRKGDISAVEKSLHDKYSKMLSELTESNNKLKNGVKKSLIDNLSSKISKEISIVPDLMGKYVRDYLDVEFSDEGPQFIVLDERGLKTGLAVDDLKKKLLDNKELASILIGTKAKGGSATNLKNPSIGDTNQTSVPLAQMNPRQLAELMKAKIESKE